MNEVIESKPMDKSMLSFINKQSAFTVATSINNIPHCATCYYSYLEQNQSLVFKSSRDTKHIMDALQNEVVAGSILSDKYTIATIKGIQFSGKFVSPKGDLLAEAEKSYYKKYPFAIAFKGDFWIIEFTFIKYTDNTLGFGKKLTWEKVIIPPF